MDELAGATQGHFRSISKNERATSASGYVVERDGDLQEIGNRAVWVLSSSKPGFGVEQLRDNNLDTYWQSDGAQPHYIAIQFPTVVEIEEVAMYTDYKLDESYTPNKIAIRCGTNYQDLKEFAQFSLSESSGWKTLSLQLPVSGLSSGEPLRTRLIQLVTLSNFQNGRDTHIRQVKIFGPRRSIVQELGIPEFESPNFTAYSIIR